MARKHCFQIYFTPAEKFLKYFAISFLAGGGFEVRNALFKGLVGTRKVVSFHDKSGTTQLQVFQDFMDLLS